MEDRKSMKELNPDEMEKVSGGICFFGNHHTRYMRGWRPFRNQ